jgi:hypothetical protein
MNRMAIWIAVLTLTATAGTSGGFAQEPVVITVRDRITIPAGTSWDSPVRFGEVCDFNLRVNRDEVFTITTFEGHEVWHIQIRDKYTNLSTRVSFIDPADYHIRFDYGTGFAFHAGVFWNVKNPHDGTIAVLDEGTFEQNWLLEFPQPPIQLTGPDHDVATLPFGTLSYCDWARGIFPRDEEEAAISSRAGMTAPTLVPSAPWGLRLGQVEGLTSRRPSSPGRE